MRIGLWMSTCAVAVLLAACSSGSTGTVDQGTPDGSGSTSGSGSSSGGGSTSSSGSSGSGGSTSSSGSTGSSGLTSGGTSSGSGSGSTSSSGASSSGGGTDGGDDASSLMGPYPSGPYGTTKGSVIANMTWIGYRDDAADALATTKPYATYSLDDARKTGLHWAMINLAETSCPGCQKSAGEIATGGKAVVDAGGVVIEVLETTGFVTQATQSSLDAWVNKYMLPVTSMKDPDGTGTATYDALGMREQAYVIDLTTMTIYDIIQGDISGIGATSGGKGMTEMHMLLGK